MDSDIYDHSTYIGKLRALSRRLTFAHVLVPVAVVTLIAVWSSVFSAGGNNTGGATLAVPILKDVAPGGDKLQTFIYSGTPDGRSMFSSFPANVDVASIAHLEVLNAVIDAPKFSQSLNGATNLRSIRIDASGVIGNYQRVYLPSLTDFRYNWLPFENADDFKNATILKDILFFDKIPNQNWDFNRDVTNLPVNISVMVDGTKIIEINRVLGIVNINVHFCSKILSNVQGTYTRLALAWCPLENIATVNPLVNYVNLNNALPKPGDLPKLVRALRQLKEFHAFQPYLGNDDDAPPYYYTPKDPFFQIPINVSDFSPSLQKLSLTRIALGPPAAGYVSNIVDLSLEESNVSYAIIRDFPSVFPKLTTVRLFNISGTPGFHKGIVLLRNVLLRTNTTKIVVTGFKRGETFEGIETIKEEIIEAHGLASARDEVERFLLTNGLPKSEADFVVYRNFTENGPNTVVKALTFLERNYKRFVAMGFEDIDTYGDYLKYDSVGNIGSYLKPLCTLSGALVGLTMLLNFL